MPVPEAGDSSRAAELYGQVPSTGGYSDVKGPGHGHAPSSVSQFGGSQAAMSPVSQMEGQRSGTWPAELDSPATTMKGQHHETDWNKMPTELP